MEESIHSTKSLKTLFQLSVQTMVQTVVTLLELISELLL